MNETENLFDIQNLTISNDRWNVQLNYESGFGLKWSYGGRDIWVDPGGDGKDVVKIEKLIKLKKISTYN